MVACSVRLGRMVSLLILALALLLNFAHAAAVPGDSQLDNAEQLFRSGKFAEAEAAYRQVLTDNPAQVAAQVGLVRSILREQKIDDALEHVNSALMAQPNSAALLATKGDVQFRLGEMAAAETSYRAAQRNDPKDFRAYLGLAHLYSAYSFYRKAYDELQTAHAIAPDNIEVQRLWLEMLPRKERLAALRAYLAGPHPDNEEETRWMQERLAFLEATEDTPVHACKLVSKVDQTETKLDLMRDPNRIRGIGLAAQINDRNTRLLLDTGAGGILLGHHMAEKAGLTKISAVHYGGIGDKGLQSGYQAVAEYIRIGELEFKDCVVSVSDSREVADEDGIIGADVFGAYVVDIDLPGMRLKLSPLPKRPEDTVAPKSLNSEGEEQAHAEQKEESTTEAQSQQPTAPTTPQPARRLPRDRYVAPEMANWTRVFRFGHIILVPTSVNKSHDMLFGLDTGAFTNMLSLRAGEQVSKVNKESRLRVRGLNGEVKQVYSAKAVLQFGHLQVPNMNIVTLDLAALSRRLGTEVSGLLGYGMLRILEVKLDYRDGLVDFVYDPKRVNIFAR